MKPLINTIKPLSILIGANVPPNPHSGASGTVWQMNQALKNLGHQVDEFWESDLPRITPHNNLHYLLELPRRYLWEVQKRIRHKHYDVIELNQPYAFLAAQYLRKIKYPGIMVNRSHGHEVLSEECLDEWRKKLGIIEKRGISRLLSLGLRSLLFRHWKHITKYADGFHVSCTEDAEFIAQRYSFPREKIGVISQAPPDLFLENNLSPLTEVRMKHLLYVGQLAFFKGIPILTAIINRLLSESPDLTFHWVLNEQSHSHVKKMYDPNVCERVILHKYVPQQELVSIYDCCGMFVFPSFFEGFGKAPLEAMSRGLCVVASNCGGMKDYIIPQQNGILCNIGDVDLFVREILSISRNYKLAQYLSTNARTTAVNHTWKSCATNLTQFYNHLLTSKSNSSTLN